MAQALAATAFVISGASSALRAVVLTGVVTAAAGLPGRAAGGRGRGRVGIRAEQGDRTGHGKRHGGGKRHGHNVTQVHSALLLSPKGVLQGYSRGSRPGPVLPAGPRWANPVITMGSWHIFIYGTLETRNFVCANAVFS